MWAGRLAPLFVSGYATVQVPQRLSAESSFVEIDGGLSVTHHSQADAKAPNSQDPTPNAQHPNPRPEPDKPLIRSVA